MAVHGIYQSNYIQCIMHVLLNRIPTRRLPKVAEALAIVSKGAEGTAAEAPTPGLSEEQRAMLKAAYNDIDTNKSGTIEVSEFKSVACLKLVSCCALELLELPISEADVRFFFKMCGVSKVMQKMKVQLTDEQIEGVFKRRGPSLYHFPEGDNETHHLRC